MATEMGMVEELLGKNCTEEWKIYSRGFRTRVDHPLNYAFPLMMVQLVSIFIVSRTIHFLLRPLKQQKFVAHILAGLILGPTGLGNFNKYNETMIQPRESTALYLISNVGVYYLVFILALKMDVAVILKTAGKKVWTIGVSSLTLPLLATFFLSLVNRRYHLASDARNGELQVMQGCMLLSVSATPQIALCLDELNLLTSELGQLAMSCALVNDIIRVFVLVMIGVVIKVKEPGNIFYIPSFLLLLYCLRRVSLCINKITPEGKPVKEMYVVGILVAVVGVGVLSQKVLGSPGIGVMIFGLIVPDGPPLGATLVNKTELMLSEFFLPSFFVEVGLNMNVNNWRLFVTYQWFVSLLFVAKLLGSFLPAAFIYKMSYRNSFLLGLVMNFKGIVEASGFNYWRYGSKARQPIDDQNYAALVFAATGFTAIVTPLLLLLHKPEERLNKSAKHSVVRTIQGALDTGELRILLCIHEEESVGSIITLLEASNPTSVDPIKSYVVHLIELVGRHAPLLVPYDKRAPMWKSSKTARIMKAVDNYSEYADGRVATKPFTLVAPFKSMHELICRLAQDKSIPLIILPFDKNMGIDGAEDNAAKLWNLGSNLQKNAACTVGILVNRGLNDVVRYEHFSYQVAVVFIGGADDREALAYGIRMSGHPNVSITLLRIHFSEERIDQFTPEKKVERQFDDKLVDEFKSKNVNNACALYRGEVAEDIVHAINLIKSLGNNYDLVMVGRRRTSNMGVDMEMESWSENPQLGMIGDVIATPEYFGGMVSVLVMQHFGEVDGWWSRSQ